MSRGSLRTIGLLLMAAGLAAAVVGCGGGDDNGGTTPTNPLVGTWKASGGKISVQGLEVQVTPELVAQYAGGNVEATIIFDADNTFAANITLPAIQGLTAGGNSVIEGTWAVNGQSLTLTVSTVQTPSGGGTGLIQPGMNRTVTYSISGSTLTIPFDPAITINLPSSLVLPVNSIDLSELSFSKQG